MSDRTIEDGIRRALHSAAPPAVPPQLLERVIAVPRTVGPPVRWQGRWRLGLRLLVPTAIAAALVIASVARFLPEAVFAPGGAPTSPPKSAQPSTTPPRIGGAVVVCGDVPHSYKGIFVPFLTCEPAVTKALAALPADHPPVARLEFGFGDFCGPGDPCPTGIELLNGYVLVTYTTGLQALVSVRDESEQSGVTVRSVKSLP
jgi:hypothetical protein